MVQEKISYVEVKYDKKKGYHVADGISEAVGGNCK